MYSAVGSSGSCPVGGLLTILSIILFSCFDSSSADLLPSPSNSKVLLADVKSLTFWNRWYWWTTNVKRSGSGGSSPHPQLRCVGGSARCKFQPSKVECFNRGMIGDVVQWECKANMNNDYKFGWIDVRCEGFDHPNDPYKLEGSCGLEYSINLTFRGLTRLFTTEYYRGHWQVGEILTVISILIIFVVFIYLVIKICEHKGLFDPSPTEETTTITVHKKSNSRRRRQRETVNSLDGGYVPVPYPTGGLHYGYGGYYDDYAYTYTDTAATATTTSHEPAAAAASNDNDNDTYTSSGWGGTSDWSSASNDD